mmetsp:Transcript_29257/g.25869  ORF Transcript_29257/g.25869 Transcript_29257/m.25869 type:complete len:103 (+) Transcript_29257:142-450(+)
MSCIVNKDMPRTVQVPSEAFKPHCNIKKNESDSHVDDMEIDENHDINSSKVRTLASFYPSSCLKATKDLEKQSKNFEDLKKSEQDMDVSSSDEDKLRMFHYK